MSDVDSDAGWLGCLVIQIHTLVMWTTIIITEYRTNVYVHRYIMYMHGDGLAVDNSSWYAAQYTTLGRDQSQSLSNHPAR